MAEGGLTGAGGSGGASAGCGSVLALRIPTDESSPVALALLRLSASELSDAIGGGLLEDALTDEVDEGGYTFYVDAHRAAKGLPLNDRAGVLAVRLGHVCRAWLADLCGDVLVLGCDGRLHDVSVPRSVVEAVSRSGLAVQPVGVDR